jgi:hypothetical protein
MSDLNALLETLDDDDAKTIREALAEKDNLIKAKARAERDLRMVSDDGLKERFPRAWRAYQKKRLDLGETVDAEEVIALLKAKEEELADLGVPAGEAQAQGSSSDAQPASAESAAPDPAAAFGAPVAGGQPSGSRNLTQEFLESMKADTPIDRDKMAEIIGEMNTKGAKDQIEQLVDVLNARPIIGKNVAW